MLSPLCGMGAAILTLKATNDERCLAAAFWSIYESASRPSALTGPEWPQTDESERPKRPSSCPLALHYFPRAHSDSCGTICRSLSYDYPWVCRVQRYLQ